MKVSRGCRGRDPLILNLSTAWRLSGGITEQAALRPAKYPSYRVSLRTCLGVFGHEKNLFPIPGFETRTVQPVARPSSFN